MATSFAPGPPTSTPRPPTLPRPPAPTDPALDEALAALVAAGTLTAEQAGSVRAARAAAAGTDVAAATPEGTPAPARRNPLPEILGYVGAALVGSALLTLVMQSWDAWSAWTRVGVVATATAAVGVTAVVLAVMAGWRSGLASGPAGRRRLSALLLAAASLLAGLTTTVLLDALGYPNASWTVLVAGAVAFVAAAGTAWLVRAVLSTLAVAAGALWLVAGVAVAWQPSETAWYLPLLLLVPAAAWLAVAPRLLAVPALSEALGWAFALQPLLAYAMFVPPEVVGDVYVDQAMVDAQQTQAWVARGLLALLAVVGMSMFLRGGRWPWAAGGVLAAVGATLAVGGQTLNVVMALLVAGVALLLCSAFLLVARRRADRRRGAAVPQRE